MEANELFTEVMNDLRQKDPKLNLSPLFKAMLDECCEKSLKDNPNEEKSLLILNVMAAFLTCSSLMIEIIKSVLSQKLDLTINYRGKPFHLNHELLNQVS